MSLWRTPCAPLKTISPRLAIQRVDAFGSIAYDVIVDGKSVAYMLSVGNTGWKVQMEEAPSRHNRDRAPCNPFILTPMGKPYSFNLKDSHHRSKELGAYAVLSAVDWTPEEWTRYDDARALADTMYFGKSSSYYWDRVAGDIASNLKRIAPINSDAAIEVQRALLEAQRHIDVGRRAFDDAVAKTAILMAFGPST